jgi:hypothetical protein
VKALQGAAFMAHAVESLVGCEGQKGSQLATHSRDAGQRQVYSYRSLLPITNT